MTRAVLEVPCSLRILYPQLPGKQKHLWGVTKWEGEAPAEPNSWRRSAARQEPRPPENR